MAENKDASTEKQKITKVADFVVVSALDLQTAFGVGPLLHSVCIHFEPKIQAHLAIIEDKLSKPLSNESLGDALKALALFPDDFLTEVVEYIDKQPYSLPLRSIVAYDYMCMVASAMEQSVKRSASNAAKRIMNSGIDTSPASGGIIMP